MLRHALLLALALPLAAADQATEPLALWAFGADTRVIGSVIHSGEALSAGPSPARLELLGLPGSDLILRPGSDLRLSRDPAKPGRLVVELHAGRIAVDLRGAGAANEIVILGAALSVRGHDCLLLIERSASDADYVAVISGQALAGLRPDLPSVDGGMAILLQARQGLRCSSSNGLAEVDHLDQRPQLLLETGLQEQGQQSGDNASWSRDDAALATNDPPADGSLTSLPVVVVVAAPTPMPPPPLANPEPPLVVAALPIPPSPPRPAPSAEIPVTSRSRPGIALIDALAEDASPGWRRRGRSPFLTAH